MKKLHFIKLNFEQSHICRHIRIVLSSFGPVYEQFEIKLEEKTVEGSDVYNSLRIMAPLDLDKYAEIAKQCKYLPENDLKVNVTFLKFSRAVGR